MRLRQAEPPLLLTRQEVLQGISDYTGITSDLLESLTLAEWETSSRCDGWQVRDVAGHLAGLFADIAVGRLAGQGLAETTARQAAQRRELSPAKVAKELRRAGRLCLGVLDGYSDEAWLARAPGGFPGPLRRAVLVLWYELYLHGDDVRSAVGRPADRGPGLRASVAHAAETLGLWGWGPATLRLPGVEDLPVRGGGDVLTCDALDFLLAATGRINPSRVGLDDRVNYYREVNE